MAKRYRTVLSIAGSDSGGGAGIQADIKTISACRCFALTAITALTAQNTRGVEAVEPVSPGMVDKQIRTVVRDIEVDAVKIGMLPTPETVEAVARCVAELGLGNVVLDPVMVATSGDALVRNEAADMLVRLLLPLAAVVTPNVPETEFMTGFRVRSVEDYEKAAELFFRKGARAVLLKSGHLTSELITDSLYRRDRKDEDQYLHPRLETKNTHGTGCTLSSAVASYLARGFDLPEAVRRAEVYVYKAIRAGAEYELGGGHGPVHHFYRCWR